MWCDGTFLGSILLSGSVTCNNVRIKQFLKRVSTENKVMTKCGGKAGINKETTKDGSEIKKEIIS